MFNPITPDPAAVPAALYEVRISLIAVRREADDCARWLARREAELSLTTEGKNAEERKARLAVALDADELAAQLREGLRTATERVAQLEAEEQFYRDVRRAREWALRTQLATSELLPFTPPFSFGDGETL